MGKWWRSDPNEIESTAAFREPIIRALTIAGAIFFLPFTINAFLNGRYGVGAGSLIMLAILAVDAWASFHKHALPIPLYWIIVPIVPSIMMAIRQQGFGPALWAYPAVILFYFVLSRREANFFSLIMIAVFVPMCWLYVGHDLVLRYFATLTVTAVFGNVIINVIGGLQQKLLEQSVLDPLTGAFNRRQMETMLNLAIGELRRSGTPASLCMFDTDNFKRINDELGHAAGDDVLKKLVALVSQRSRKIDSLFRIGGEEFVVLLRDTSESDALIVAEQLRKLIEDAELLPGRKVTASFGVSGLDREDTLDTWLKFADDALYRAKQTGRNKIERRNAQGGAIR